MTLKKFSYLPGESQQKQYRTYIEKWMSYCKTRQIDEFEANLNNVLSFDESRLGYSCLYTARSALLSFLHLENVVNICSHPLIHRFMRGVLNVLRPALPKYNVTWDVNIVLKYLKLLFPLSLLLLQ